MDEMKAGVIKAQDGMDGVSWNIFGQDYVPKQVTESSFSWHATFHPGEFVPPHIHPNQDEFLYILEGQFDFVVDGQELIGTPGDLVKLPRGCAHGIWNKTEYNAKTLFWVSPTRRLYDLFWALHKLGPDADPAVVVAVSAEHEVDFIPPEDA